MDEPQIYRPKRSRRIIGVLMMIAGAAVFLADWEGEQAFRISGYAGIGLFAIVPFSLRRCGSRQPTVSTQSRFRPQEVPPAPAFPDKSPLN